MAEVTLRFSTLKIRFITGSPVEGMTALRKQNLERALFRPRDECRRAILQLMRYEMIRKNVVIMFLICFQNVFISLRLQDH